MLSRKEKKAGLEGRGTLISKLASLRVGYGTVRRSWMRCPVESTSRSSPNFKLGSCSLAFAIIYQQQNSMVVK